MADEKKPEGKGSQQAPNKAEPPVPPYSPDRELITYWEKASKPRRKAQ